MSAAHTLGLSSLGAAAAGAGVAPMGACGTPQMSPASAGSKQETSGLVGRDIGHAVGERRRRFLRKRAGRGINGVGQYPASVKRTLPDANYEGSVHLCPACYRKSTEMDLYFG